LQKKSGIAKIYHQGLAGPVSEI